MQRRADDAAHSTVRLPPGGAGGRIPTPVCGLARNDSACAVRSSSPMAQGKGCAKRDVEDAVPYTLAAPAAGDGVPGVPTARREYSALGDMPREGRRLRLDARQLHKAAALVGRLQQGEPGRQVEGLVHVQGRD